MIGGLPDKADLVFLIDGSGSIDETDEFYNAKHLVSQVLLKLNIGENKVRVDRANLNDPVYSAACGMTLYRAISSRHQSLTLLVI